MNEPTTRPLTRFERRGLLWAELFRVVVTLALVLFVYATSVTGRSDVVGTVRDGCERTRTRIHLLAADASKRGEEALAGALLRTIPASCSDAYPDPGPVPFGSLQR